MSISSLQIPREASLTGKQSGPCPKKDGQSRRAVGPLPLTLCRTRSRNGNDSFGSEFRFQIIRKILNGPLKGACDDWVSIRLTSVKKIHMIQDSVAL